MLELKETVIRERTFDDVGIGETATPAATTPETSILPLRALVNCQNFVAYVSDSLLTRRPENISTDEWPQAKAATGGDDREGESRRCELPSVSGIKVRFRCRVDHCDNPSESALSSRHVLPSPAKSMDSSTLDLQSCQTLRCASYMKKMDLYSRVCRGLLKKY